MERVICGSFQVTVVLTDKRQLVMSGHVYNDDDAHAINQRVDAYQDVLDRQAVRMDVANKEAQVASLMAGIEQHNQLFTELVKRQEGGAKLTSAEKERVNKFDLEVAGATRQLESTRAAILAGRRKLNGAA